MADRYTEYMPIDKLSDLGNPENPKQHDLGELHLSMDRFGYVEPITLDERTGLIVSGHGRVQALVQKRAKGHSVPDGIKVEPDGTWLAPVTRGWSSHDDQEAKAFIIAANRLTTIGGWDEQALTAQLADLYENSSLEGIGYGPDDLQALLEGLDLLEDPDLEEDDFDEGFATQVRTVEGDVWQIGPHRLMCGDSTVNEHVIQLLDGQPYDLLVTSPPYNAGFGYDGEVEGASDNLSPEEYSLFIKAILDTWTRHIGPGRMIAWNIGCSPGARPYHHAHLLEQAGLDFVRQIIWHKPGVPLPTFHVTEKFRQARRYYPDMVHEMLYLFSNGEPQPGDSIRLLDEGRYDVWKIAVSGSGRDLPEAEGSLRKGNEGLDNRRNVAHPAVYPVKLPATAIGYLTAPEETVVDPFNGAGTTMVAAHELDRVYRGMELQPMFVDLTIRRMHKRFGIEAVNVATGEKFDY